MEREGHVSVSLAPCLLLQLPLSLCLVIFLSHVLLLTLNLRIPTSIPPFLSPSSAFPPSLPPPYPLPSSLRPSLSLPRSLSPLVPLSLRPSLSRTAANHLVDRSIWPHTTARLWNRVGPRFLMHCRQGWQTQVACGREKRPRSGRSCGAGSGAEVLCVGGDADSL